MFCSVKKGKDKYGETYKFYLCERYRDKESGKVKSSDKYIMTLQYIDFTEIKVSIISKHIKRVLAEREIFSELEEDLIYDKYLDIREGILERERAKKEEESKRQQEEYNQYREYYKSYTSSISSSINFDDTTKELAKEFIKLGYRAMAKKYHPDITKDNGEKMKSINEIKDKLDNIF